MYINTFALSDRERALLFRSTWTRQRIMCPQNISSFVFILIGQGRRFCLLITTIFCNMVATKHWTWESCCGTTASGRYTGSGWAVFRPDPYQYIVWGRLGETLRFSSFISETSLTIWLQRRRLIFHHSSVEGFKVMPMIPPGLWPYLIKVDSMYMSDHIAFHWPGWCRVTFWPCRKSWSIGPANFYMNHRWTSSTLSIHL